MVSFMVGEEPLLLLPLSNRSGFLKVPYSSHGGHTDCGKFALFNHLMLFNNLIQTVWYCNFIVLLHLLSSFLYLNTSSSEVLIC